MKITKNVYQVRSGKIVDITDEILKDTENGKRLRIPNVRVVDTEVKYMEWLESLLNILPWLLIGIAVGCARLVRKGRWK